LSAARGLLLAAIQVGLVACVGGKALLDRHTRPRHWVRATAEPDLPMRGRYLGLRFELPLAGDVPAAPPEGQGALVWVRVMAGAQGPVAHFRAGQDEPRNAPGLELAWVRQREDLWVAELYQPASLFLPGGDPRWRLEPLWVEVTVPRKGPLRPIRLGTLRGGRVEPL
jgi:hypothetical protein